MRRVLLLAALAAPMLVAVGGPPALAAGPPTPVAAPTAVGDGSPADPNVMFFGRWDTTSATAFVSKWAGAARLAPIISARIGTGP